MDTSGYDRLQRAIVEEIKALVRDRGVERDDDQLLALLRDRLQILCRAWGIDLTKGAAEARAVISERLDEHLSEITPVELRPRVKSRYPKLRGTERKTQFERVIHAVFNVDRDLAPGIAEVGMEDRLAWLTTPANRANGIDYSLHATAARRDYERAREIISGALARRELSIEAVSGGDTTTSPAAATQADVELATDVDQMKTPQRLDTPNLTAEQKVGISISGRRRFGRRAVLIGIAAILLAGGSVAVLRLTGDTRLPATGTAASGAPITVLAQYPPLGFSGETKWVLPTIFNANDTGHVNALGPPNAWAPSMHGVFFTEGTYELNITGNDPNGVIVTNIGVSIVQKKPSLNGTVIYVTGQGMNLNQDIMFNLDDNPPIAQGANLQNYGSPFFANQNVSLAKNEPITFYVAVDAKKYDYLFDLVFTIDVQGKLVTYKVSGPNGQPFQVSGEARTYDGAFVPTKDFKSLQFETGQQFCAVSTNPCANGGS